jgi:pimeloyl-ACP methyl ester carboxylesterase
MVPETRYAKSGEVSIAYQVLGQGPPDLVCIPGWVSNVEICWESPEFARFLNRLASFSRLILFDKRGTGLSDRVAEMPSLEVRMDDVRAVLDAVGSQRAALFGYSEGGIMCALFAATYPERTAALIMQGSYARLTRAPGYPWGMDADERAAFIDQAVAEWGGPVAIEDRAPSMAQDPRFRAWWARYLRLSASPSAFATLSRMNAQIDIRGVLPAIRVPTLILHSINDRALDVGGSRYLAQHIDGAKLVELSSFDHIPWLGDAQTVADEVEEFVTGVRHQVEPDRVLATVLFTDIVGATEKAARVGDRHWHDLVDAHHALVRRELGVHRGREIDTAGDGFLAAFDGPARAIRCACAISQQVRTLGIDVRAGLHTGECEIMGDKLGGIAVHIGARIAALAGPGEVLVSSTVKDLVAGSGLSFVDRGSQALKGVPNPWQLFAVGRQEHEGARRHAS